MLEINRRTAIGAALAFSVAEGAFPAFASTYSTAILADTPSVYYKLGESSGLTATDSSGNANNGTYSGTGVTYGATALMVGDPATSVILDGLSGDVTGPNAPCTPGSSDFSLEMWIKTTATGSNPALGKTSSSSDTYWAGTTAGQPVLSISNGGGGYNVTSLQKINDGAVHHVVFTKNATTLSCYIDGSLDTATTVTVGSLSPTNPLLVGNFSGSWFNGTIGQVAYYPSALSLSRVAAHYIAGTGISQYFAVSPTTVVPRTASTVITLTGTNTTWGGTTVFTVTGGGASKVSQSVASATSATVTVATSAASGAATITETVTGSAAKAVTVLPYKQIFVTPGGISVMILEPAQYNPGSNIKLIMYHGGVGEGSQSLLTDTLKTGCVNRFLADGYLLVGVSAAGDNWGNQAGLNAYNTAFAYIIANYPVVATMVWSQSMGGLAGLLQLGAGSYINCRIFLGTYPACNLANLYANGFGSSINIAYNIPGGGTYAAQTAGHDPALLSGALFNNMFMRFYASPGDSTVNAAQNSGVMSALCSGAIENTLVTTTGNHGDPSNFQPSDYSAFAARAFAGTSPGWRR